MKNIITVISAMLLTNILSAQVKFNLSYQEATKVYTVSVVPEATWETPKNLLSSAQIVLRVDAGNEFVPGITSLVEGLTWADNAYIEQPDGAPEYTFVCISLVNGPTAKIAMVAGQEIPLFTFINAGSGCAGRVTMLANSDPMVQAVRGSGFNVTQHFAVLGARGNAFTGFINNEVDCTTTTGSGEPGIKVIEAVKISPLPADKTLTIQWTLLSDQHTLRQMVIYDAVGREVLRETVSDGIGTHAMDLNVEHWKAGMYRMRFVYDKNQQTQAWNIMLIH